VAVTLVGNSALLRTFCIWTEQKKQWEINSYFAKVTEEKCEETKECTKVDTNVMSVCPHNEKECGDETPALQP
jgi:GTP cyclohydrolase FolE2